MVEILDALKRTVARVEIQGRSNGTAFLVGRKRVATALHVLDRYKDAKLVFPEWERHDRERAATQIWLHPSGHDLAVLELDRPCPDDVKPLPWCATPPALDAQWITFGFPSEMTDGHPLSGPEQRVSDPKRWVESLELRILQLHTPSADEDLGGFSGAPCLVDGAVVGVVTHQLRRTHWNGIEKVGPRPSLHTLFAMPITLLAPSGTLPPNHEAFADHAKPSVLSELLRALDQLEDERQQLLQRAAIARRLGTKFRVVLHVVWGRENKHAAALAEKIYCRFTRSQLSEISPGLRIPTFLYDQSTFLSDKESLPIDPTRVERTIIVMLRDDRMTIDRAWRECAKRIASTVDNDPAGTVLVPVELGARKGAQFGRLTIEMPEDAPPARLLLALEERLLSELDARPAPVRQDKSLKLFISHAKADGLDQASLIKALADATPGVDALLDSADLRPGSRLDDLSDFIPDRVLVALVTPAYMSRPWCRREFLTAKQLGVPIVVVNLQPQGLPRAFPYGGNVPWLEWRDDEVGPYDVLEAAGFEMLRERYAHLYLEDQTLLMDQLRSAHIVSRPPEMLDVIDGGFLAGKNMDGKVLLHPDPPLTDEERDIVERAIAVTKRSIKVTTPGQAMTDEHPLWRANREPLPVMLSASPADALPPGLRELHFQDAWLDLVRLLLLGGATLAFGGDLREGGLTNILLEVAEQRAAADAQSREGSHVPVRSYLGWPSYFGLDDAREAQLIDRVEFTRVEPPASTKLEFPSESRLPTDPETRYLWSLSMTRLRRTVRDHVNALVVLGGKTGKFAGRYAGVVEEVVLAMDVSKPIFLLGGFGGAAAAVGQALLGGSPASLTATVQLSTASELDFVAHYNKLIAEDDGADDRSPIDHDAILERLRGRGLLALNNGLSDEENRLLLTSPSMQEALPVLLRGLRALVTKD